MALKTEIKKLKLKDLQLLDEGSGHENARFMKPAQFKRLVENLKADGELTSAPLVARIEGEKPLYVVSGNHRVSAAIEAGIEEAHCIVVAEPLQREKFIAYQLSHNAIEGEDDPVILKRLYDELDLEFKEFSGLTDEHFDVDDFSVTTLSGTAPLYLDVIFAFLPEDAQAVEDFMKTATKWSKKNRPVYAAEHELFDKFFNTIVKVKDMKGITNSAVALRTLVDLANERMEQLEQESADEQ